MACTPASRIGAAVYVYISCSLHQGIRLHVTIFFSYHSDEVKQVEDVIWKISVPLLARRSEVFTHMFSLPVPAGSSEGQHALSPIILEGTKAAEFSWLMKYLLGDSQYVRLFCTSTAHLTPNSEGPTTYTLQGLVAVLRLSDKYLIPSGVRFAFQELNSRPEFGSSLRLSLSLQTSIPRREDWFKLAVRDLLRRELSTLKAEDYQILEGPVLHDIVNFRMQLDAEVTRLITQDPPYSRGDCAIPDDLGQCEWSWRGYWGDIRTRVLVDKKIRLLDVHREFEAAVIPGMCAACSTASTRLVINQGLLMGEEHLIIEGVDTLCRKYMHTTGSVSVTS